ncbi:MAG: hypothetical protein K8T10_05560 [Candidatus Eremiobacteraeota bacterium]|nr:hypothetical protein [Candidatus Eremiobacteraeota bacterium]
MKKFLVVIFLLAFVLTIAASAVSAMEKVPNLVGHWHGKSMMHFKKDGFKKAKEPLKFIVKKQEGRVFTGTKIWISNGKEMSENFSGVVAITNKKIYIAEHEDGLVIGDIVSKNKIVIYYIEDGENSKVIITELDRVK